MKALLPLMLVAAVLGCEPQEPPAEGPVPANFIAEQAACLKRGGRWGRAGAAGFFVCYEETRDGGKSCAKATDCETMCLARSRSCAPFKPVFGCQDVLMSNGARSTLCLD